jgi:prophage regulatory protein
MAHQLRTALTILRRRQIEAESGYSRSTLYLRIAQGLWTKQISLGARAVGWPAAEVDALNAARIAGKTDAEIRALVLSLEAARTAAEPSTSLSTSI